jgi:hypothetical protein
MAKREELRRAEAARKEQLMATALAKLSDDEREALGV